MAQPAPRYAQPEDPLCAIATPDEIAWLESHAKRNCYLGATPMGAGSYAAVMPLMFTGALIHGSIFNDQSYDNRWCYKDVDVALYALREWRSRGFEGEPLGWHRHPATGRRRPDGDATKEYVEP